MKRKELCSFGIAAKKKLVEINKPQTWLLEEVRKETGQYIDSGYLGKIWTGERKPQKLIDSICGILKIEHSSE